eukprot:TRINITY_DN330_c0_g1_i1.p1 TRINITY_DN330_c0_g1~~TRINITY_DN330_c0_g1_i1.p1  ORF type:complete len:570 (-),score=92.24 TRINITY_DN330_c0_g1_i1:1016-2512(-)
MDAIEALSNSEFLSFASPVQDQAVGTVEDYINESVANASSGAILVVEVVFWMGCLCALVSALRWFLHFLLGRWGMESPSFFLYPCLEATLVTLIIPGLVTAAATLIQEGGTAKVASGIAIILLCVLFAAVCIVWVVSIVYKGQSARFVVEEQGAWRLPFLSRVFGNPYPAADWSGSHESLKTMERYGFLIESFKGVKHKTEEVLGRDESPQGVPGSTTAGGAADGTDMARGGQGSLEEDSPGEQETAVAPSAPGAVQRSLSTLALRIFRYIAVDTVHAGPPVSGAPSRQPSEIAAGRGVKQLGRVGPELEAEWNLAHFGSRHVPVQRTEARRPVVVLHEDTQVFSFTTMMRCNYYVVGLLVLILVSTVTGIFSPSTQSVLQLWLLLVVRVFIVFFLAWTKPYIAVLDHLLDLLGTNCDLITAAFTVVLLNPNLSDSGIVTIGWVLLICQLLPVFVPLLLCYYGLLTELVVPSIVKLFSRNKIESKPPGATNLLSAKES